MTRTYTPYFAFPLNIGDDIDVGEVKYYCLTPCTVVGYANDTKQPVIEDGEGGVKEVIVELVKAEDYLTKPQTGLTTITNIYLGKYKQIGMWELDDKTVAKTMIRDSTFLILCTDNTYVKMASQVDQYSNDECLRDELLTIDDLRTLDLIDEVEWGYHMMLVQKARKERDARDAERRLADAAKHVAASSQEGYAAVQKILKDYS